MKAAVLREAARVRGHRGRGGLRGELRDEGQMLVHEHALVKLREDMPLDRAALIGCEVTIELHGVDFLFEKKIQGSNPPRGGQ